MKETGCWSWIKYLRSWSRVQIMEGEVHAMRCRRWSWWIRLQYVAVGSPRSSSRLFSSGFFRFRNCFFKS